MGRVVCEPASEIVASAVKANAETTAPILERHEAGRSSIVVLMDPARRTVLEQRTSTLLTWLAVSDAPEPADMIWGLGSNEPRVAEKAAALYRAGLAPWVVFSGGRGHRWSDMPEAEADMFARHATSLGVPADRIVVENGSTNTAENVTLTLPLLEARGIGHGSALLVTIPPFQRRAGLTVQTHRHGLHCVHQPIDWGPPSQLDDEALVRVAELCAGEITRLRDYPAKGYIRWDPSAIPDALVQAAADLRHWL